MNKITITCLAALAGMTIHQTYLDMVEFDAPIAQSGPVVHGLQKGDAITPELETRALDQLLGEILSVNDDPIPRPYLKPKAYYTPDEWLYIARTPVKVDAPVIATAP